MRIRSALLLVTVLAVGLALVGCKKAPAPEESPVPTKAVAPAAREHAKAPTETMSGPNGEPGGQPGSESGGPRFPELKAEPLKTAGGEEISLFGPLGATMLGIFTGQNAVVEGDNTKGTIKGNAMGSPTELSYEAGQFDPAAFGIEGPAGAKPSSGFTLTGLAPEASIRPMLEAQARQAGESQPKVTVSEDDRRIRLEACIYLAEGKPSDLMDQWVKANTAGISLMPMGEDTIIGQCKAKKDVLVTIARIPDKDNQLQVMVLRAVQIPAPMRGYLDAFEQIAAGMAQGGGPGGPGGPPPGGPARPGGPGGRPDGGRGR